jgi:hypothetical protein
MMLMRQQWHIDGMSGTVTRLALEALPAVLAGLGVENSPALMWQIDAVAAAMRRELNRKK